MFIHSITNQGRREYMEDEILHKDTETYWISAVFDGHGGGQTSKILKEYFGDIFEQNMKQTNNAFKKSLAQSIQFIHQKILQVTTAGSTANIVVYAKLENKFYVANVGDSRAIMTENNQTKQITRDHKPSDPIERDMIIKRRGSVINGRVNGNLAVSRAIGDRDLAHIITAYPDIYVFTPSESFQFILHASDGLFDVLTNEQIGNFVMTYLNNNIEPKNILNQLVQYAIQLNSMDNISVSLILKHHHQQ